MLELDLECFSQRRSEPVIEEVVGSVKALVIPVELVEKTVVCGLEEAVLVVEIVEGSNVM